MKIYLQVLTVLLLLHFPSLTFSESIPTSLRAREVIARVAPTLKSELKSLGFHLGAPVFMRIIKELNILEVFIELDISFYFLIQESYFKSDFNLR